MSSSISPSSVCEAGGSSFRAEEGRYDMFWWFENTFFFHCGLRFESCYLGCIEWNTSVALETDLEPHFLTIAWCPFAFHYVTSGLTWCSVLLLLKKWHHFQASIEAVSGWVYSCSSPSGCWDGLQPSLWPRCGWSPRPSSDVKLIIFYRWMCLCCCQLQMESNKTLVVWVFCLQQRRGCFKMILVVLYMATFPR